MACRRLDSREEVRHLVCPAESRAHGQIELEQLGHDDGVRFEPRGLGERALCGPHKRADAGVCNLRVQLKGNLDRGEVAKR